jgi:hypothetical protein
MVDRFSGYAHRTMTDQRPSPGIERLAAALAGERSGERFAIELAGWLAGSTRFRAFAEAHRAKIAKKVRGAADPEALLDVRAELAVANLLLADRRIEVAFEAYGSGRGGPDFTVAYRAGRPFNLEVTRRRVAAGPGAHEAPIVAKLRQLPSGSPNLLLIAFDGGAARGEDVADTVRTLRARADAKDEEAFVARGFDGTRGFYDRFLRLSGVITWIETAATDQRVALWTNASARSAVPAPAARAVTACLRGQAIS